jgi:predicted metal-binding membrane protein
VWQASVVAQANVATNGPAFRRAYTPVFLLAIAAAWIGVVAIARDMGAMTGTMGLGLVAFVAVWALMMAAMMLPAVAPFASFYTRTFTDRRGRRLAMFSAGYILVRAGVGVPAFALALLADRLLDDHATAATGLAVAIFVACGVYQLTPWKDRCLALCRSPLGFTLRYGAYRGRTRDLRVGAAHGLFCLGCCWALMGLLLAFGLMNVAAMVAIAAIVLAEKTWAHGLGLARVVGVASLVVAALVIARPQIASGLYHANMTSMRGGGM